MVKENGKAIALEGLFNHPGWKEYMAIVEGKLEQLRDLQTCNNAIDLERRKAVLQFNTDCLNEIEEIINESR